MSELHDDDNAASPRDTGRHADEGETRLWRGHLRAILAPDSSSMTPDELAALWCALPWERPRQPPPPRAILTGLRAGERVQSVKISYIK